MYYIYILYSEKYDRYYIGYTTNYLLRLEQHNTQEYFNTYTSKFRPWQMAAVFVCGDSLQAAMKTERFIKKQKSRMLIEKLIDPHFVPGGELVQLVRVPQTKE